MTKSKTASTNALTNASKTKATTKVSSAASKGNILISACLLGNPVRYNGTGLFIKHPLLKQWKEEGRLISICPEVAGGLPTPRAPAEIIEMNDNGNNVALPQVINNEGEDVSNAFIKGANLALELAQKHHCIAAILTERSPSCGSSEIYDGTFSGTRKSGMGITTRLLEENGVRVFNQNSLEDLVLFLALY